MMFRVQGRSLLQPPHSPQYRRRVDGALPEPRRASTSNFGRQAKEYDNSITTSGGLNFLLATRARTSHRGGLLCGLPGLGGWRQSVLKHTEKQRKRQRQRQTETQRETETHRERARARESQRVARRARGRERHKERWRKIKRETERRGDFCQAVPASPALPIQTSLAAERGHEKKLTAEEGQRDNMESLSFSRQGLRNARRCLKVVSAFVSLCRRFSKR